MLTLKKVAENHGLTKEGVDYALSQYQIIISEITYGMLSKLSYDAHDVLAYAQDRWCETCELKQPAVEAVPLDKLCECLVRKRIGFVDEVDGKWMTGELTKGAWAALIREWMEELDDGKEPV